MPQFPAQFQDPVLVSGLQTLHNPFFLFSGLTIIYRSENNKLNKRKFCFPTLVHFEKDESGTLLPQPGDDEEDILAGSPLPAKTVDESMQDLISVKKRNLDQWCFAEHLEPAVFLQVLKTMFQALLPTYSGLFLSSMDERIA